MKAYNTILEELQAISPLVASIGNRNVFSVPDGYFETLPLTVLAGLTETNETENSKFLSTASVPNGYFDHLAEQILARVKAVEQETAEEEISQLSPLLHGLSRQPLQSVPNGYFEGLADQVQQQLPSETPVISIDWRKRIIRMAAAACIAGALGLGIFQYMQPSTSGSTTSIAAAGKLDPFIEKGKSMTEAELNAGLENLSVEEITNYLEKNGGADDVASLTSTVEPTNLPSEETILLDEKTLEKYLQELELKN